MSLIETMIALTILVVIITAVTSLMVQINSLSNSTRLKSGAVSLAQSSLEQVRGYYQQNGWAGLSGKAPCFSTCPETIDQTYSRSILITVNGNQITVQSYIYWIEKGVSKTVESDTYFYNY